MNKLRYGIPLLVSALSALSGASNAATEDMKETKGVKAFRACYESSPGKDGSTQKLEVVVEEQPKHKAAGTTTVKWDYTDPYPDKGSITCEVQGPWYFMCTMKSCNIRYEYTCAEGVKGMLVVPNWGAPGKFVYTFPRARGGRTLEQDAAVCN